ncbi:hypothetical protein LXL04_027895 [Taraxacum kok-saghyz]
MELICGAHNDTILRLHTPQVIRTCLLIDDLLVETGYERLENHIQEALDEHDLVSSHHFLQPIFQTLNLTFSVLPFHLIPQSFYEDLVVVQISYPLDLLGSFLVWNENSMAIQDSCHDPVAYQTSCSQGILPLGLTWSFVLRDRPVDVGFGTCWASSSESAYSSSLKNDSGGANGDPDLRYFSIRSSDSDSELDLETLCSFFSNLLALELKELGLDAWSSEGGIGDSGFHVGFFSTWRWEKRLGLPFIVLKSRIKFTVFIIIIIIIRVDECFPWLESCAAAMLARSADCAADVASLSKFVSLPDEELLLLLLWNECLLFIISDAIPD